MSWLRKVLGSEPAPDRGPVREIAGIELPLGLRLGAAVALDPIAFTLARDAFVFAPPAGHSIVEAYGSVDLGAGAMLHRFYLTDDAFVQVNTTAGAIDELKYFVFHETRHPATIAAFRACVEPGSALGAATLQLEGRSYRRVWGESEGTRWAPPVVMDEKVYRGRPPKLDYDLTHYCMLYQRDVEGIARTESVLVSAEDYGPDEFCITCSVGVDVTTADLDIT